MKTLILVIKIIALLGISLTGAERSLAESGIATTSCSRRAKLCEDGSDRCHDRYFYIYSSQYALFINDKFESENHTLNTSGFIDDTYQFVGPSDKWIIYQGKKFRLALPWKNGAGIYVRSIKEIDGPSVTEKTWKKLCK